MRKQLLFIAVLLCLGWNAKAQFSSAAEIRYEYTGVGNIYRVFWMFYARCGPGGLTIQNTVPICFRNSTGFHFNRNIQKVDSFYYTNSCYFNGLNTSVCDSITSVSSYPGYFCWIYSDTATLAPNNAWKISCTVNGRDIDIDNLWGCTNAALYVEALLNNSAYINSSPKVSSPAIVFFGRPHNNHNFDACT